MPRVTSEMLFLCLLLTLNRATLSRMLGNNPSKPIAKPRYPKAVESAKRPEKVNPSLIKSGKK